MGARILLVEDNAANLELARFLLEAGGHTVLSAEDGAEALRVAGAERPDLIVTDLQMPVMDGYELLRHIRADERLRGLRVVALTAFSMADDQRKVLVAGFDGYLSKPIVPETFVAQIGDFLPGARPAAAAGGK